MKNRWIKIVLVASLALNLAFTLVWGYRYFTSKSAPRPIKNGAESQSRLDIKEAEKREIDSILQSFRLKQVEFKQKILEKRMDIIDELGDPDLDLQSLQARVNELNETENQLNLAFVATLVEIDHILDSQQRIKFLYQLSRDWFFIQQDLKGAANE